MPAERPRRLLRRVLATLSTLVILVVGVGVPAALVGPVPKAEARVTASAHETTPAAAPRFPRFGSAAVGVADLPEAVATSGSQKQHPIASITKVITALVVLERKPLRGREPGPTITFDGDDVDTLDWVIGQDGSHEDVEAGWRMSQRQAMETMLIPSANNYAISLARWAYGSEKRYVSAAQDWLRIHGLTSTTIVDPSGLDPGDRSTPRDLVRIGELALKSPVVRSIVAEESAVIPNVGEIDNTNKLLDDGLDGIKTGTTDEAGACLLFAERMRVGARSVQLVGVILGAPDHDQLDETVMPLLKSVRRGLHDVSLAERGRPVATYRTAWGGTAKAVAAVDASTLVWSRRSVASTVHVDPIRGGSRGERVGTATYRVDDRTVTVPLALDRDVLAAPFWWRLTHPIR